jgi:hypothetical protein
LGHCDLMVVSHISSPHELKTFPGQKASTNISYKI